jgi:hypothetical protein
MILFRHNLFTRNVLQNLPKSLPSGGRSGRTYPGCTTQRLKHIQGLRKIFAGDMRRTRCCEQLHLPHLDQQEYSESTVLILIAGTTSSSTRQTSLPQIQSRRFLYVPLSVAMMSPIASTAYLTTLTLCCWELGVTKNGDIIRHIVRPCPYALHVNSGVNK